MKTYESKTTRTIVGRLEKDDKLPDALYEAARRHNVQMGEIRALGAVTDLAVTEWDEKNHTYREPLRRKGLSEVLFLYGNLSKKDGQPFLHLHINTGFVSQNETHLLAGHLVSAKVFALEFIMNAYDDLDLVRTLDAATGLALWE